MARKDTHNLDRFLQAQDPLVDTVTRELKAGRKRSHWMWFVFPQVAGLGQSPTAQRYAIGSLEEAEAYFKHPVLGTRLVEWTRLVLDNEGRSAEEIFGFPDYLKFCSSMTLFSRVPGADPVFTSALDQFYNGTPDRRTLQILGVD